MTVMITVHIHVCESCQVKCSNDIPNEQKISGNKYNISSSFTGFSTESRVKKKEVSQTLIFQNTPISPISLPQTIRTVKVKVTQR